MKHRAGAIAGLAIAALFIHFGEGNETTVLSIVAVFAWLDAARALDRLDRMNSSAHKALKKLNGEQ